MEQKLERVRSGDPYVHRDRILVELGDRAGDMALRCSDAAGFLAQLDLSIAQEASVLGELTVQMDHLAEYQTACDAASVELQQTAQYADSLLHKGHKAAEASLADISTLVDDVMGLDEQLQGFLAVLESVSSISDQMSRIAAQTRTLGLNASIEAARGGEITKGFGVVADEVRRLAVDANESAARVSGQIQRLDMGARALIDNVKANVTVAERVGGDIGQLRATMTETAALVSQLRGRSADIGERTVSATQATQALRGALHQFARISNDNAALTGDANARVGELEDWANDILNTTAHSGVKTTASRYIDRAIAGSAEIMERIRAAISRGELTQADVFDADYQPIAGTEPVQYHNRFVDFADRHLRPMLDAQTARDSTIFGCCLVDRNGFLPTHISDRSQAQRFGHPEWNTEHARNRQFFLDNQTRRVMNREGDYFVCTYRQDLGEGHYRALRSILVPMIVGGRRWGLYELGYLT
jgi:methyl-accepting chemotaxis protein